ncbi:MAG: DNA gyrase C-terminal beta-propeller domain-containing protein, partial [bacterium]|nr:DNA gyrase C-terminal beta-propeller domain-containing protein [bacterium]
YEIIKEELLEIKDKYGDDRKTQIIERAEELTIEDLIKDEDMVIIVSHTDYIKRLPITLYRKQRRGGRGVIGMDVKDEDFVKGLFIGSTHDYILFFSNIGKVHWLRVFEIPEGGRLSRGRPLVNLLSLSSGETIAAAIPIKEFQKEGYLIMATKKGLIKKTTISAYSRPRKGGIVGINLVEGDELISVGKTEGADNIILATRKGKAIRFSETDVREMGRAASGVRGISLTGDDQVVGMEIDNGPLSLLTITERGYGKRTDFEKYKIQKRGGKGIINIKIIQRNGEVVGIKKVGDKDELMMITSKGIIIRYGVQDLPKVGRATQGVKLINLEEGDKVVNAARISHL